jgi:nitroreductase
MLFKEMVDARYSVKSFDGRAVEEEKLQAVLEAAGKAPTARNAQCVRIYVLKSEAAMDKARELTPCTYGAPVCLLVAYDRTEAYRYPDEDGNADSGAEDCAIVATHVMFEALEQGLGTCWVNRFSPTKAKEVFVLPKEQEAVLMMPIGYPAENARPLANHEKKKPLAEIVTEL